MKTKNQNINRPAEVSSGTNFITYAPGTTKPLMKGNEVSLHSHKGNCLGVRFYHYYLDKYIMI